MIGQPSAAVQREELLDEILAAYLKAVAGGQAPPRQTLLEAHPDLAAELAAFFADEDQLGRLATPLRQAGSPRPGPLTGQVIGNYELLGELGRGGMGVIYKARQVPLNRIVALKMIRTGELATEADRRRFQTEAEAVANLDHPHIVPIYEVGEHQRQPYFSMKLVEGGSLAEAISRRGVEDAEKQHGPVCSPRLCTSLLAKVARAVHYAHQRGILHRDLKPANILLDAQGQPHVTDFGLAKRVKAWESEERDKGNTPLPSAVAAAAPARSYALTHSGAILGTPSYMAPEQAWGGKGGVSTAADIYSLGVILYELLTGQPPFRAATPGATLRQVLENEPVRPRVHNPQLERDVETICLKCLEKEPARRYASAAELADDLERFLNGEPIHARPVGNLERAWRWCRRNPALAMASTLAVAALVTVAVVSLVAALRLSQARQDLLAEEGETREALAEAQRQTREAEHQRAAAEANGREKDHQRILAEKHAKEAERQRGEADKHAKEAERRRAEAEASFRLAHRVVEDFCIRLSEDRLSKFPGLQPVQKQLLEGGLKYHQEFLKQRGEDPALRADMADTHFKVALITSVIGSKAEADAAYERAAALYQDLLRTDPDNVRLKTGLARTYINLGALREVTVDAKAALVSWEEATILLNDLACRQPEQAEHQRLLALTYMNMGNAHRALGELDASQDSYRHALTIQEELIRLHPTSSQFQSGLAIIHVNIGVLQAATGQKAEALQSYERARDIQAKLFLAEPKNQDLLHDLALSHRRIGHRLGLDGRPADALRSLQQGYALFEKLAKANPSVTEYQADLASSHRFFGNAYHGSGEPTKALKSYQEACTLLEKLVLLHPTLSPVVCDLSGVYFDMGVLHGESGHRAEAIRAYQRSRELGENVVRASPDNLDHRYTLGVTLANLALLLEDEERYPEAVAAVQRAIEHQRLAAAKAPRVPHYRDALNRSLGNLAEVQKKRGRPEEALATLEEGRAFFAELVRADAHDPQLQSALAFSNIHIGNAHLGARKFADALAAFGQARALQEKLVAQHPQVAQFQAELAKTHAFTAEVYEANKQRDQALRFFERARTLRERLVKADPDNLDYRSELGGTLNSVGYTLARLHRFDEAAAVLRQGVEQQQLAFGKAPHVAKYRWALNRECGALADILRAAGQPAEAVVVTRKRLELWPDNPKELYAIAREVALAAARVGKDKAALSPAEQAERNQYADYAMEALRQARASGFQDSERLQKDKALDLLRQRADFQTLVAELQQQPARGLQP
jgi:serine/threonine-protein kinase